MILWNQEKTAFVLASDVSVCKIESFESPAPDVKDVFRVVAYTKQPHTKRQETIPSVVLGCYDTMEEAQKRLASIAAVIDGIAKEMVGLNWRRKT